MEVISFILTIPIWLITFNLLNIICIRFNNGYESLYLKFLSLFIFFAYFLKSIYIIENNEVDLIGIFLMPILFLLFVIGLFLGSNFVKTSLLSQKSEFKQLKVRKLLYFVLIIFCILLAFYTVPEIIDKGMGVLSRPLDDPSQYNAGFIVRIQDLIIPITLMSLIIISKSTKNNYFLTTSLTALLIIHLVIDSIIRLTKTSFLIGFISLFIIYFQDLQNNKKIRNLLFLFILVLIPIGYSFLNYLRTGEVNNIAEVLVLIFNRLVGAEQYFEIIDHIFNDNFEPLINGIKYLPDKYFTYEILNRSFGYHTDAPSFLGYFLIQYGVLITLIILPFFGFIFSFLMSIIHNSLIVIRACTFSTLFFMTSSFFVDGNIKGLFDPSFSTVKTQTILLLFLLILTYFITLNTFKVDQK